MKTCLTCLENLEAERILSAVVKTLNAELNPIRHLLALVGARHIVHVSRIRIKKCVEYLSSCTQTIQARLNEYSLVSAGFPSGC